MRGEFALEIQGIFLAIDRVVEDRIDVVEDAVLGDLPPLPTFPSVMPGLVLACPGHDG